MATRSHDRSAWWSRSRGLPKAAYAAWALSLRTELGHPARILAWSATRDGFCVGSPGALSFGDGSAWTHLGWHQIERGGWDVETSQLTWQRLDGDRGAVDLPHPGRLPELFRERVAASIALEKFVALSGQRGVTITARRDLAPGGSISWHSSLTRGLTWQTAGVREAVEEVMAEVRTEYDFG